MFVICGLFVFKEKLGLHQKIGLVLLLVGLVLFFNDRLDGFQGESRYLTGVLLSLAGSLIWVAYGMAQKLMLRRFSSPQIFINDLFRLSFGIYACC